MHMKEYKIQYNKRTDEYRIVSKEGCGCDACWTKVDIMNSLGTLTGSDGKSRAFNIMNSLIELEYERCIKEDGKWTDVKDDRNSVVSILSEIFTRLHLLPFLYVLKNRV